MSDSTRHKLGAGFSVKYPCFNISSLSKRSALTSHSSFIDMQPLLYGTSRVSVAGLLTIGSNLIILILSGPRSSLENYYKWIRPGIFTFV